MDPDHLDHADLLERGDQLVMLELPVILDPVENLELRDLVVPVDSLDLRYPMIKL